MKKIRTLLSLSLILIAAGAEANAAALLWSQDFNAGGTFGTYVQVSPVTSTKFQIASGYASFDTTNFDLRLTGPTTSFADTTGQAFGTQAGYFQTDVNLLSASQTGSIVNLDVGSYSGTADSWLRTSVNVTNFSTLTWGIRNTGLGVNSGQTFTGPQTLTYVINNSGASFSYNLGGGISGTLANNFFRIYVGSTALTFSGNSAIAANSPTATIEGFRFSGNNNGLTGVIAMDNISLATIDAVPEPSTSGLIFGAGIAMLLLWRRRAIGTMPAV